MSADLELALRLVDAADALSLRRFRARDLVVETKPDLTPVTEADRAVEEEIRAILARERPGDAILGEELGASERLRDDEGVADESGPEGTALGTAPEGIGASAAPGAGGAGAGSPFRRWVVDPIDGTRNYSRGVPVWATLVALEEDGRVTLGVVSAPALQRRWWAERGGGAHTNGDRVHVSAVRRAEDAVLSFALEQPVPSLAARAWHARGYGDFWSHMLVAEGAIDGAIDAIGVAVWDLAAVQVIVEEAGGTFTDFAGEHRVDGGSAISSNGHLHAALLEAVASSGGDRSK